MRPDPKLPVQVTLVRTDATPEYNLEFFHKEGLPITKVFEVGMFDRNTQTFLCCATPSFWVEVLRIEAEWPEGYDVDDAERERFDDLVRDCMDPDYRDCGNLEEWIKKNPSDTYVDEHEYETMDEAREYHQGNHVL